MAEISLGDALQNFLKNSKMRNGLQALQIEDVWESIMGKTIARYTDKLEVINKTLFVTTTVAPLKNELMFQKENIIKRVNEELKGNVIENVIVR